MSNTRLIGTPTLVLAASLAIPFIAVTVYSGQAETAGQKADKLEWFMREKLTHAQQVLEGLSLEDYDKIAGSSQRIALMSLDASWQVLQTSAYAEHSAEFRRIVDRLAREGRNKNLDGATTAYVEMTLKCVNCHKYVRAEQRRIAE